MDHFAPVWGQSAIVTALAAPAAGYFPIFVKDTAPFGLPGIHTVQGTPYAVVQYGSTWSLTASHECLEMIADPGANRRWSTTLPDGTPAEYIVEVCDPCQAIQWSYAIGPWIVSDFVTPHYYDSAAGSGIRYSYRGNVTAPKQVLPGGTVGFIASDGHARQVINNGGRIAVVDRGPFQPGPLTARSYFNLFDKSHTRLSKSAIPARMKKTLRKSEEARRIASENLAAMFERDMTAKRVRKKRGGTQ